LKHCDNPECSYFKRIHKYAEYRDDITLCSDCGSILKDGGRPDIENNYDDEGESLVNVASYRDLQDAYLVKGKLESEGIQVFLRNEHTIGIYWLYSNALGGIKLDVPESQVQQAQNIIEEDRTEEITNLIFDDKIDPNGKCPICNSTNTQFYDRTRKFAAISCLIGLPLLLFGRRYKCLDCKHVWKPK